MATNPSVDELEKKEEELFQKGPLQVLTNSVKTNSQVRRTAPGDWWAYTDSQYLTRPFSRS